MIDDRGIQSVNRVAVLGRIVSAAASTDLVGLSTGFYCANAGASLHFWHWFHCEPRCSFQAPSRLELVSTLSSALAYQALFADCANGKNRCKRNGSEWSMAAIDCTFDSKADCSSIPEWEPDRTDKNRYQPSGLSCLDAPTAKRTYVVGRSVGCGASKKATQGLPAGTGENEESAGG